MKPPFGMVVAIVCTALANAVASQGASVSPVLSSQDFGSLALNASSSAVTLTFRVTGASATPNFTLRYGTDFTLAQPTCTNSSPAACNISVTFAPTNYAGVRQDALLIRDSTGALLSTTFLHGIGLASEPVLGPGVLATYAGNGVLGYSGDGGFAINAELSNPQAVAVDSAGNVYIADSLAPAIRRVSAASGIITTIAGPAGLNTPTGLAIDGAGNVYIADSGSNRILKWDAVSNLTTVMAGTGAVSSNLGDGNLATQASLHNPTGVAVDPAGNLYIADQYNNRIRRVDALTGIITTVAGGGSGNSGRDAQGDGGLAVNALLNGPAAVALDSSGNLYIADSGNNLIREVHAQTGIISVIAGNGSPGDSGDGSAALQAALNQPVGVQVDAAGDLYIVDSHNNAIRQVNGAGVISTIAAGFNNPGGMAIDSAGNVYIADQGNSKVSKLVPGPATLNFGTVPVGQLSTPQTASVSNIGNQSLTISTVSLSGGFDQQSSGLIDCVGGYTLPAASSCSVSIAFAPQSSSSFPGSTLSMTTNASPISVSLNGTGTGGNPPITEPTISALSFSFGSSVVGSTQTQTLTLTNTASVALTISIIFSSPAFSITTCPSSLAAHTSCTVTITFQPQIVGPASATLFLSESSGNTHFRQSVFIQGMGLAPSLTVIPAITFGSQALSTTSGTQTVTLTNSTAANLPIIGISLSGPSDFSIVGQTCPAVLNPNSSCTVTLSFIPMSAGLKQANLQFYDLAANSPQTVQVQGYGGTPSLQAASATVNFGEIGLGGSVPLQISFANPTGVPYLLDAITISGANATDFSTVNTCGTSVISSGVCTLAVKFFPLTPGIRNATLTLIGTGAENPVSVGLTGIAVSQTTFGGARSGDIRTRGDFDGDGMTDYVVWRPANGCWYVIPSSRPSSPLIQQWGLPGDIPVPADYDGDGKTDLAVWRPSNGTWYVIPSGHPTVPIIQQWGLPGDIPVPGNYKGTGKADFTVWRPSNGTWYVLSADSAQNYPSPTLTQQWGLSGDVPVPADYDGDGKTDFAVWRPSKSTWYVLTAQGMRNYPNASMVQQWGLPGDIPVPEDYDEDGKADFAVWRPSNGVWFVLPSSRPNVLITQQWGLPGDIPVPGNYNGRTGFAVWRPSEGNWYLLSTNTAYLPISWTLKQWGLPWDIPR